MRVHRVLKRSPKPQPSSVHCRKNGPSLYGNQHFRKSQPKGHKLDSSKKRLSSSAAECFVHPNYCIEQHTTRPRKRPMDSSSVRPPSIFFDSTDNCVSTYPQATEKNIAKLPRPLRKCLFLFLIRKPVHKFPPVPMRDHLSKLPSA